MEITKKKNNYWIIAGAISGFTAVVHLIGGQLTLVDPLLDSNLSGQVKTEWLSAWHIVTFTLFLTAYYLLKYGMNPEKNSNVEVARLIGILYLLFSVSFILSSLAMNIFAPQWILLLPIGLLTLAGRKKLIAHEI